MNMTLPGDSAFWMAAAAVMLPFLSSLIILVSTRSYPRTSAGLSVAMAALSFVLALFLLYNRWHSNHSLLFQFQWLVSGTFKISFGFLLDPLSLIMVSLVAAICLLVQIYSLGYMSGDPGFSRYFGFHSLFAGSMMGLTLSSTLLQLYFFWELVGLCSYLLIGFWYEKFSATEAGKKAFVMTRLGDLAFFLGLLLLLLNLGQLDIPHINGPEAADRMSPAWLTLSALLLFGGIIGKSAQFPLMTWLPDAMEGPTPVSALLHSATMVAAGVFLLVRLFPFFSLSGTAMTFFMVIGTVSMLMASFLAMADRDIKKILAYSTISQLGYMIMALAAGDSFSGFFHLTTHAGFKALLFLCAGVWIHYYGTNDLFEISRQNGRRLKIPLVCLILGGACLSGLPPLSGFFSKEAVLTALARLPNPLWLIAALAGVFLTSYYTFRAVFIILCPRDTGPEEWTAPGSRPSVYWAMSLPLLILTASILTLGFLENPLKVFIDGRSDRGSGPVWLPFLSLGSILSAILLAWMEFGRSRAPQIGFVERKAWLRNLLAERWYLDRLYRGLLTGLIYRSLAGPFTRNDQQVIDGGLQALSNFTLDSGRLVSFLQSGKVRYNLFVYFLILVLVSLYFFLSG